MKMRVLATIAGILLASSAWAQWNIQTVDNSGNTGTRTSIAYDAQGYPHICYSESTGSVRHAYWTGHAWAIEGILGGGGWHYPPTAMVIDDSGTIHVACGTYTNTYKLFYCRKVGGAWLSEEVAQIAEFAGSLGLCVDGSSIPHITFSSFGVLRHAHKPASSWVFQTIDAGLSGTYSSIVNDAAGHLYVAYSDDSGGDLKFAYYDGSVWSTQIVDMAGTVATYGVGLKLDGSGNPCIAYYDQTNGDLKYATFTGTLEGKSGSGPARQK